MAKKLKTPALTKTSAGKQNLNIKRVIQETREKYKKALEEFKFSEALKAIWGLISFCDKYIDKKKPWEDRENSTEVLKNLLFIINKTAGLLEPFLPETSEKIIKELEIDKKTKKFKKEKSELLFPRIDTK